jgi:hypothetical protein
MTGQELTRIALAAALALAMAACGSAETDPGFAALDGVARLQEQNGLSPNGLSRNGLSRNGLSRNGLSRNGLSRNGLLSAEFQGWFDEDPATSAAVMTYVARCAVPAGQSLAFTSASTGVTYAWAGSLGLAPGWASGLEATEAEEQVITACLAAHVNKYGVHVDMSVLGRGATGVPIPIGAKELSTFSQREGCFFGNLFRDEGVYVGLDHGIWDASYSSARACAFDIWGVGPSADCPPVNNVGPCWLICKADPNGSSYQSCGSWVNGAWRTYLPITTRIRPSDVYRCGDGTCQFTETSGTGTTANSCKADCGDGTATQTSTTPKTSKTSKASKTTTL